MDWGLRFVGTALLGAAMFSVSATGRAAGAAEMAAGLPPAPSATTSIDFLDHNASPDARRAAQWAFDAGNAQGKPFAVVDKKDARIFVFDADGRLLGAAPVLLGSAKGDESAPGVGQKVLTGIPPDQRTTPAGRFDSEPGHNSKGEAIVWVDYDAAIAIHRLRPAPAAERRPQRLASGSPDDKRISLGCIVVAPEFYDAVVAPLLGRQRGVVYVLPETPKNWSLVFGPSLGRPS